MSFPVQSPKNILLHSTSWVAQAAPNATVQADPAIDRGAQHLIFLGVALLSITVVLIIGVFSSRTEHAIIAAIVLSLILIGLFFMFGF